MSNFFKPKDLLKNEGDKVQVKVLSTGEKQAGNYGDYWPTTVMVNGKEYSWSLSTKHKEKMDQASCGTDFWIIAYKTSYGSLGYNYAPVGDVTANVGNDVSSNQPAVVEEKKDDFQDKISRGAAWNNAFAYYLRFAEQDGLVLENFLTQVAGIAEQIAPHQKTFVNGISMSQEANTSPETHSTPKDDEPPLPIEAPPETKKNDLDLPF